MSKNSELYCVLLVQKEQMAEMAAFGIKQRLKLSWADGMIGVIPVFEDKEKAERYADGKCEIMTVVRKSDVVLTN